MKYSVITGQATATNLVGVTRVPAPVLPLPTATSWPRGWLTPQQFKRKQLAKKLGEMSSRKGYG